MGGAKKSFSASEAETIAESFRDLAKRLNCLAEEILAVKDIDYRQIFGEIVDYCLVILSLVDF